MKIFLWENLLEGRDRADNELRPHLNKHYRAKQVELEPGPGSSLKARI